MQYTVLINQQRALEWGLNPQQAILFSMIYTVPSWANVVMQGDQTFYAISKQKIVDELPLLTDKPDTAYRLLKALEEKGLINLSSTPKITLIQLTNKAKKWNYSEQTTIGNNSDAPRINLRHTSDKSPTNQSTNNQSTNIDSAKQVLDHLNKKAGTSYKHAASHIRLIYARMNDGATVDEMKNVIDLKCRDWLSDNKMKTYLRPSTLFTATNYDNYVGALPTEFVPNDSTDSDDYMAGI